MKNFEMLLRTLTFAVIVAFAGGAHAQETSETTDDATAAPAVQQSVPAEIRPAMPRLFYTNEQRRILEVVRQEFITEESLDFEEFAPLLIEQQETVEEEGDNFWRNYSLRVGALIRNRSSGDGRVWINNQQYSLEDVSGVLEREGLGGLSVESDGAISGMDSANKTRFLLKVGQTLAGDGEINETYPVIVVKKQ